MPGKRSRNKGQPQKLHTEAHTLGEAQLLVPSICQQTLSYTSHLPRRHAWFRGPCVFTHPALSFYSFKRHFWSRPPPPQQTCWGRVSLDLEGLDQRNNQSSLQHPALAPNPHWTVCHSEKQKNRSVLTKLEGWPANKLVESRLRKRNGKEPGNSLASFYSFLGTWMNQLWETGETVCLPQAY